MNKTRNESGMTKKARARTNAQIQTVVEPGFEPFTASRESPIAEFEIWKPFEIGRSSVSPEWLNKIQNLSGNIDHLGELLKYELSHESWLNVFLLAAGAGQITEDYLHSDPFLLGRAAKFLEKSSSASSQNISRLAFSLATAWTRLSEMSPRTLQIEKWHEQQIAYISQLAALVMNPSPAPAELKSQLIAAGLNLYASTGQFPATLLSEVNKLPSCFRSFDQRPEDIEAITTKFATRWTDKTRVITIVGIRTSGSFLAPLYAAALTARGYTNVNWITLRPGAPLSKVEKEAIRRLGRQGGLALVCDDPPSTGGTIQKVSRLLERSSISRQNIVLLLQLFDGVDSLPSSLKVYASVLTPWNEWAIQRSTAGPAIRQWISDMLLPGKEIASLEAVAATSHSETRSHVSILYRVAIADRDHGSTCTADLRIKGIGLGYFGEHHLAISKILPDYSFPIIALKDGLVVEQLSTSLQPIKTQDVKGNEKLLLKMADYVLERNLRLPWTEEMSLSLRNRNAVWEVASNLLSMNFGKAWFLLRMPMLDAQIKRILDVPHPSVIDGDMDLKHWFISGGMDEWDGKLLKANQAERDFSHEDLGTFDPAYDLAGLALAADVDDQTFLLRTYFQKLTGDTISPERWMLHQLVRLWDVQRHKDATLDQTTRRMSQVVERYFSETYFQGVEANKNNAYCVFDLDGVLETNHFGFASLSPASARGLRALHIHGYPILIASGRSLDEVKERCSAYHLDGGIAEYGSAVFDSASGKTISLLNQSEIEILAYLRTLLKATPGVFLDEDYKNSVRAFGRDAQGNRIGLNLYVVQELLAEHNLADLVTMIPGKAQTDFTPGRVNKALGVNTWLSLFAGGSEPDGADQAMPQIVLAVGDDVADIPVLRIATQRFAPAHARRVLKGAGIRITRHPYQCGFEEAVAGLLGHAPGNCPVCRMLSASSSTEFMRDVMSVQEDGRLGMISRSLKLLMKQRRYSNVGTN